MEDLSLQTFFIYSIFCLSPYGLMGYFYALDDNPVLLISLLKLCPALAIESRAALTLLPRCFCWLVCLFALSSFIFFSGTMLLQAHPVYILL